MAQLNLTDVLGGALIGAPFTAAAGMAGERRLDKRRLRVAARAIGWSLAAVSQAAEIARNDDWWLLAHATGELETEWDRYADTLRGDLPGPEWRVVEDTVRSAIHLGHGVRDGDLDHWGESRLWLGRFKGLLGESEVVLRPYAGSTPRKYRRRT
jgi:hypothetical protein